MRPPHDPNDSMTSTDRSPHALVLLALLALSGLLFFLALGDMGLTDRDEGRNAEAGREMFESGDRLTPTFNGELRIAKPVFIYWLMEQSYRLFGVNEFAARFPSALFGVGLIFIHYLFLVHQRDQTVALFGGLMLLLNLEILGLGRMALTDSVLIFFTTASLYGFWLGLHGEGGVRRWIWAFYIGMALATLTKGPVGFAVPIIAAALYLIWTRRWREYWQKGVPLAGLLLFILLAAPWYAAMFLVHGDAYATGAKANTIGRFLSPMEGHQGTIFFYLPVLLLGFFPWSALLPVPLYHAFKNWRSSGEISRYPPATLHWPIVSRRRPIDSLVLVAVPARSDDERDSRLHSSHDGTGVSLGGRLCLPPHALRNLCLQDGAGVPLGRTGGSRQQSLSGRDCVVTRDDVGRISWIERRTARRSVLGGGGDLGQSCSDRHRDRDSAYQSICDRAPAGTRLCRGTEPQSPGSIHCLWHHETVVRILRETQDALRTHWGRGQDTGGPERAKESDDPIAGERTIEVAGGSKRASPHSQTLRLRAAGQPADGDDSRRRNPATSAQHSRPLNG